MKSRIETADRKEADQIRAGLSDAAVRAFVKVVGILSTLPTDRARRRILSFVMDRDLEERESVKDA